VADNQNDGQDEEEQRQKRGGRGRRKRSATLMPRLMYEKIVYARVPTHLK